MIPWSAVPELPVDPAALGDAAERLRTAASRVPDAVSGLTAAWVPVSTVYDTDHTLTLAGALSTLPTAADDLEDATVTTARALADLADELGQLERELLALRRDVTAHRAAYAAGGGDADDGLWILLGQFEDADLRDHCDRLQGRIDEAVDACVRTLGRIGVPPVVPLGAGMPAHVAGWATARDELRDDLALAVLNALATGDVRRLLTLHPEWADLFRAHPPDPEVIADWWAGLADGAQTALVYGAPVIVGALGGVPALSRAAANRQLARVRLAEARARLRGLEAERAEALVSYFALDREIDALRSEVAYLERATTRRTDGTYATQLYLYDPARHRIIEMYGALVGATTAVTYVPGTFTTEHSLYRGDVQDVALWMATRGRSVVAFVWKDGLFPGASNPDDQVAGILEANEQERALNAGERLASFQAELPADPALAGTRRVAIGHSWGLAAVTGSEVADAHYDQVESLAGAYMPEGWEASPDTTYTHQTYTDFLSVFQDLGAVGDGNVPDASPAFDSTTIERPGDYDLYLPTSPVPQTEPPPSIPMTTSPMENHSLIASSETENLIVLQSILERMRRP